LTSLEREEFPIDLVGSLYRLRWQIELAIKRLKSILHIDRLPAQTSRPRPCMALCPPAARRYY